jgi:hypothetical protein
MKKIKEAISHYRYGIKCDIFSEPVTSYAKLAVEALERQIPKKPNLDNDNGVYEKEHCPTCHRSLFPNDHHCRCGQAIDWSD